MSEASGPLPALAGESLRSQRRAVVPVLLRALGLSALLVVGYYILPFDHISNVGWALLLVAGLIGVALVVGWEARCIIRADRPIVRAIEATAFAIPFFILLFATTYYLIGQTTPSAFSEPLSRTDALYFTITVFATVGFGDIVPKSAPTRLLVSAQMLADLVLLGVALRVFMNAARVGIQRRYGSPATGQEADDANTDSVE